MNDSIIRTVPLSMFGLLFGAQIGTAAVASQMIRCVAVSLVSTGMTTPGDGADNEPGPDAGPDEGSVNGASEPLEEPILTNHGWRLT